MKIEWARVYGGQVAMLVTPAMWNLDWDIAGEGHKDQNCITIKDRQEAVFLLQAWCDHNPGYLFKVFATASGVRAYCLSHKVQPWSSIVSDPTLRQDPIFLRFMQKRGYWRTRVSSKPNRVEKPIYSFVRDVGEGVALKEHLKTLNLVLQQAALNSI